MIQEKIAKHLLDIQAVFLRPKQPFTWTSGIKSPIYCDNRLTLSYPAVRRDIANGMAEIIKEKYPEVEVVAGTATAGIPHAAWVSEILDLPMAYVRSSAKAHGKGNQIEGAVEKGQKVVVVEDLISTGGSVVTAVEALRQAGCEVLGVVSIFTYELDAAKNKFQEEKIINHSLSNYSTLVQVAVEKGMISKEDVEGLTKWRENPRNESWLTLV